MFLPQDRNITRVSGFWDLAFLALQRSSYLMASRELPHSCPTPWGLPMAKEGLDSPPLAEMLRPLSWSRTHLCLKMVGGI